MGSLFVSQLLGDLEHNPLMSIRFSASQDDTRARVFSKAFSTVLRIQDRATLIGPPESPRDHVIAASKAMRFGNWRNATKYIFSPKMDAKV